MLLHLRHQDGPDRHLSRIEFLLLFLQLLLEVLYLTYKFQIFLISFLPFCFFSLIKGVQLIFQGLNRLIMLVPPLSAFFELLELIGDHAGLLVLEFELRHRLPRPVDQLIGL